MNISYVKGKPFKIQRKNLSKPVFTTASFKERIANARSAAHKIITRMTLIKIFLSTIRVVPL